jgi:hypothetical protein
MIPILFNNDPGKVIGYVLQSEADGRTLRIGFVAGREVTRAAFEAAFGGAGYRNLRSFEIEGVEYIRTAEIHEISITDPPRVWIDVHTMDSKNCQHILVPDGGLCCLTRDHEGDHRLAGDGAL